MLGPLISGVLEFIRRPLIIVPAIIAGLLNTLVWYILLLPQLVLIESLLVFQDIPKVSLIMLPYVLFTKYWFWFLLIGFNYLFSIIMSFWIIFVYSHWMSEKKATIGSSIGHAMKNFGKIIGLSFFMVLLTIFFGLFSLVLLTVIEPLGLFGSVFILLWILLIAYVFLKLVFLPFIYSIEKNKIREALKQTWDFTGKHFFMIILLLGVLQLIMFIITQIGLNLSTLVEDEFLNLAVGGGIPWIGFTYSAIVISKFYIGRK